ncbi:MAG: hypothetical protein HWD62_14225 [Cyclobacteriaceae bacterium]|nr:MAG: hypothetical protein HWD62_14225 [Cyclobacteriaceae bacterium]
MFKLADHDGNEHYIMSESFYRAHNHKSPITKNELDYYDRGQWITALVEEIEDKSVVIKC